MIDVKELDDATRDVGLALHVLTDGFTSSRVLEGMSLGHLRKVHEDLNKLSYMVSIAKGSFHTATRFMYKEEDD